MQPSAPRVSVDSGRIEWLDAAKGLGILLVVLGHALGGLIDSKLGAGLTGYREAFFAIYTFHMPLFFMLSGVLVAARLDRKPAAFARSLGTNIAWPYFLWSAVQFTIIYAMGGLVNQPVERYWPTILSLPWHTVSQFWFLYALFLLHGLALLALRPLGGVAFFLVCLALKPLTELVALPEVLHLGASHAPFYGLGVFLGVSGVSALALGQRSNVRLVVLGIAAAVLIALALSAASSTDVPVTLATARAAGVANLSWQGHVLPAALAGTFAAVALASAARGRLAAVLAYLGQRTMPIFVLHILAIAGSRIVLINLLGFDQPWLVLLISSTLGIIAPLLAYAVLQRLRLSAALGLG